MRKILTYKNESNLDNFHMRVYTCCM